MRRVGRSFLRPTLFSVQLCWLLLFVVAISTLLANPARAEVLVAILEPSGEKAVLGRCSVEAEVTSREAIEAVVLVVDGQAAEELRQPPFHWVVDVGEGNRGHSFEVIARSISGQEGRAQLRTPSFRVDLQVEAELQQVYVVALRGDQVVSDLGPHDLTLLDDGDPQELVTFERGDLPLTAMLLVDASDSMSGGRLELALAGARSFLKGLRSRDQARLVLFSDRTLHAPPFTSFGEVLTTGLEQVSPRGGTALNDHLFLALKQLEERPGRGVVVVLSDGVDTASVLTMKDLQQAVDGSSAWIFWIRTGNRDPNLLPSSAWRDSAGHQEELGLLEKAVLSSGGRVVSLPNLQRSEEAFESILRELREQYVLGYYPSKNLGDGRWHRVTVKTDRPGLELRFRQGYVDYP